MPNAKEVKQAIRTAVIQMIKDGEISNLEMAKAIDRPQHQVAIILWELAREGWFHADQRLQGLIVIGLIKPEFYTLCK